MTTTEYPTPQKTAVPECIYCDRPMRQVLRENLKPSDTYTHFACTGCGWEVMVPSA